MPTGSILKDIKHHFRYGSMVMKLIFVNAGVFVFWGLFLVVCFFSDNKPFYDLAIQKFETPASLNNLWQQPWSVFTYMFLHAAPFHVLFNMLWFYWFGSIFVLYVGDKKILPLYILGGLVGAFTYILAFNFIPVFKPQLDISYMLGASASIFAIVFAAATLNPDHEIRMLFLGTLRIKYIAIAALVLDVINIPYGNAGGYIAHAGGAFSGFLYIKTLQGGFDIVAPFISFFDWLANLFKPNGKMKMTYRNTERERTSGKDKTIDEQKRVDEILDKISRSGYDGLTKEEKDFLFHYSNK
jgi:membrane associated rhomboid family serine protease